MKLTQSLIVFSIAVILTGCDSLQPQPQSAASPAKTNYQRFVPIAPESVMTQGVPWHGYFALDTQTGSLCRTVMFKNFPKGSDWANDILSCSDILAAEKEAAKH
jgi:hypothetical protein